MVRTLLPLILVMLLQLSSLAESRLIPFQAASEGPYFISPQLMLDSAEFDTLILRLEAEQSASARLLFATSYDARFDQFKSASFTLKKGEHDYYLNVSAASPAWLGWITGFVIVPESGAGQIGIRSVRVTNGNLFTHFRSGWQEFWQLETIKGRTVNIIMGQRMLGRHVNFYAYLILALAFLFLAGREAAVSWKKGFDAVWQGIRDRLGLLVVLALVLVVLLEVRLWFDYSKIASADHKKFWGRSLEEKHDLIMGGGYYDFLAYCNKVLPPRADIDMYAVGDFYRSRGPYYLYPHRIKKNPPYIIIFHKEVAKDVVKGYSLFAKYKEGEYILKKNDSD
ncbi:hypothetical protein ACFL37_01870 [Candidatus Margulisiibacteriota bacterium]